MTYMPMPFVPAFTTFGLIAGAARLEFYLTGTTTPANVYSDAGLTTPLGSVVTSDAFGRFVAIYLDPLVTYRVRLETSLGALIQEADGVSGGVGSADITFVQAGAGSATLTGQNKMREIISFADKAAPTDGTNATTAITNALATGRHVEAGSGNYHAQGITMSSDGQVLAARGTANILRNATGTIITSAASDITIQGIAFYGEDPTYTGNVLSFTGARGKLLFASARDAGSDKVLNITGDSWLILGTNDVYDGKVTITSPGGGAPASLYHNIIASRFNGLVDFTNTGLVSVAGCLFAGGLTVDDGAATFGNHGARLLSSRVVGTLTVTHASTSIGSGMSVSGNVVIGDGVTPMTGISVDPSFVQSGGTFTILAGVKGTFHLGALYEAGVSVTIPDSVRIASLIYHGRINYTTTISGDSGSYVAGSSVLTAKYSQQGCQISGYVQWSLGAGVTVPTGGLYCTVPIPTTEPITGSLTVIQAGVPRGGECRIFTSNRIAGWFPRDAAADSQFAQGSPYTLASGDTVIWTFQYDLAGL